MVIAYLYGELLNLYGNDGNVRMLVQKLTELGVEAEVRFVSVEDVPDFSQYDIVYMGSGTESNQRIAIEALRPYREEINDTIEEGRVFLITGNSIDIFGEKLDGCGKAADVDGLGIFGYHSEYVQRIRKMYRRDDTFLEKPVLGFLNHNYKLVNNYSPLFGSDDVRVNNFFGTYLEGPVLIRNPHFLRYILSLVTGDVSLAEKADLRMEEKAYDAYLSMMD